MDKPLLALTRQRVAPGPGTPAEAATTETMRQLVELRWIAVVGQLATILVVHFGLGVILPLMPMLTVIALLVLGNVIATAALSRHAFTNLEIMAALLLDMGALTAQLYFSGGADNPFIAFYLLQVVVGAILLATWSVWVFVGLAAVCYAGLIHASIPLVYPPSLASQLGDLRSLGAWISFALTAAILGLFITRIIRNLRAREQYLADLRQRTAEEDGIVRMGLFASGAAHELGTPLATLSVILGDWRRMPKLARDRELLSELDDMQAEVQRCKAIVTDILHSAGEPRGETMESRSARAFLDDIIAAWRPTHSDVTLDYACADLDAAAVAASTSLRQAIWNLLDNAAEVSPGGIALRAGRDGDNLVIAVTDDGPGFDEAQLKTIGKPYQSRKGAGHGLGLFLTANVARRLGGRLEAGNHAGGGADVRLLLPITPQRSHER